MDWLILLLLGPLIVFLIVFFCGFAGCSFHLSPGVAVPSGLVATPVGTNAIVLSWTDNTPSASRRFRITRQPLNPPGDIAIIDIQATGSSPVFYTDPDLPHAEYDYWVVASVFDDSSGQESIVESGPSNVANATTGWQIFFNTGPTSTVGENRPGPGGPGFAQDCLVQRIPAGLLKLEGRAARSSAVRLTVRGSTAADLRLRVVSISHAAPAGDRWDSEANPPPVPVLFQGSGNPVTVAAGTNLLSDETVVALHKDRDLIVAFEIGTPGAARLRTAVPGAQAYVLPNNSGQAALSDRSPNFQERPENNDAVFIVEKIEVLQAL